MDKQLKQRLLGAAVVISLAVIFLPMILDGGRYTEFEKIRIEIPQSPNANFSSSIAPLAPPEVHLPMSVDTGMQPDIDDIEAEGKAPILDAELTEMIKPIEAPRQIVSEQGKDVRKPVAEKAKKVAEINKTVSIPLESVKPKVTATVSPPALPLPEPSAVTAWVVQVGSFASRQSAIGLRDKVRKQGFAAFVESFDKSGKPSHRVRVGPESTRARSDNTLAALKKKMQLNGIVVPYP